MVSFNLFSKNSAQKVAKKTDRDSGGFWGDGRAVLSAIDDGVIALDASGNVKIINPAAERMIGWTNRDAIGLIFESILRLANSENSLLEAFENPVRKSLSTFESFYSRNLFLKTDSGKSIPISLQINPIDENKNGLVIVFRDISREIKENREQAEFISTASHEMRTPVASIEGYLGLALNPATATIDVRAREFLDKAYKNTRHLGKLFQDLLDITKSEDGRLKTEPVVVDVIDFTRDIWAGLRMKAEEKGLDYIFEPDENKTGELNIAPVFYVNADKNHLQEALDNLFENAIKYTHNGRVSVNVSGDKENVRISVSDDGIGIPAEDIPHLFQKFYRVDNSETREIGGTGLGLYLTRRLIESMNGKISLTSEYKKGSVFTIQLPRLTRDQAEKLQAKQKEKATEKEVNLEDKYIFTPEIETSKVDELHQQNIKEPIQSSTLQDTNSSLETNYALDMSADNLEKARQKFKAQIAEAFTSKNVADNLRREMANRNLNQIQNYQPAYSDRQNLGAIPAQQLSPPPIQSSQAPQADPVQNYYQSQQIQNQNYQFSSGVSQQNSSPQFYQTHTVQNTQSAQASIQNPYFPPPPPPVYSSNKLPPQDLPPNIVQIQQMRKDYFQR